MKTWCFTNLLNVFVCLSLSLPMLPTHSYVLCLSLSPLNTHTHALRVARAQTRSLHHCLQLVARLVSRERGLVGEECLHPNYTFQVGCSPTHSLHFHLTGLSPSPITLSIPISLPLRSSPPLEPPRPSALSTPASYPLLCSQLDVVSPTLQMNSIVSRLSIDLSTGTC